MARLPTAADLGSRPLPQGGGLVARDRSGQILGEALQQAGENVRQIGEQQMEREDRFAYAQARSALLTADLQTRASLMDDPDYATHTQRYRDTMTKQVAEASKGIKSNPDRAAFVAESRLDMLRGALQVQEAAKGKEIDQGRAQLSGTLDRNREAALSAPDEGTRKEVIQNTLDNIAAARERGYLTAQEAEAQQKGWTTDYAEGALIMMAPADRIKALEDPKGTPAEFVPADRRMQLDDAARRQMLADSELADRQYQRGQKERSDEAAKEGDLLGGDLTMSWIEAHREILDPADLRYFVNKLESGGAEAAKDPLTYADLRYRAGQGEVVEPAARAALQAGNIRQGDYSAIVSEQESSHPNWAKQGDQYIKSKTVGTDLNPDPAAAATFGDAMDEWNLWKESHQSPTNKEAREAYQDIVYDHSLAKLNGLPPLRYFNGNKLTATPETLAEAEQATVQAFNDQTLSPEDFKREAKLLKEWRETLEMQAAP